MAPNEAHWSSGGVQVIFWIDSLKHVFVRDGQRGQRLVWFTWFIVAARKILAKLSYTCMSSCLYQFLVQFLKKKETGAFNGFQNKFKMALLNPKFVNV